MSETTLGTPLYYLGRRDLSHEEIDALWEQGVCMDDWDYVLLAPADILAEVEGEDEEGAKTTTLEPFGGEDYYFENLLRGCYDNRWYRVPFRGEVRAVGVAYHA